MKILSKTKFENAVHFIKTQAMDIDRAMFEYFFEGKLLEEVIKVLTTYQNEDGGFGMLDYDMACPVSCMKTTESACRYIFELDKIPADNPMIQKLIPYIVHNYNKVSGDFDNLTVPEVNDYPHAFWWAHNQTEQFVPKNRAELLEHYDPNTNSALAGMLVKYSSIVPRDILEMAMSVVIEKISLGKNFFQYGMLSDVYFVNSLTDNILKDNLLQKLMGDGKLISLLDEVWSTENAYKLCNWIDSPNHSYYGLYKQSIEKNFDFLIDIQNEDGSWSPSWSWGEPEVWKKVETRLKGLLTYKFLLALKKFDFIEE